MTAIAEDSRVISMLNQQDRGDNTAECLTCGMCNSRCSWFDAAQGPIPRQIIRMATIGMDHALSQSPMLWTCMLCNRCTLDCPMGIVMDQVVRKARSMESARHLIPADLKQGIQNRLERGDVNAFSKSDFIETIDWLNEEISDETDDPRALIPYDQRGADYLYLPNPRELGTNLMHLTAMARLFYHFNRPWTLSTRHTDVTNWGYFSGDDAVARKMLLQVVEAAEDLAVKTLVISECGHGYFMIKTGCETLIGRKPGFEIVSMPQLILEMVETGVIQLNPDSHPFPVAYHDPCNIGRKSGMYEVPRKLLARCCREVIELSPSRADSICCGGGGGLLQDSATGNLRMASGKRKAEQIKQTGVKHLATACHSCHRQLTELSKHYTLGVSVHTVAGMAADALVTPN